MGVLKQRTCNDPGTDSRESEYCLVLSLKVNNFDQIEANRGNKHWSIFSGLVGIGHRGRLKRGFKVQKHGRNEVITERTRELLLDAKQTAMLSGACSKVPSKEAARLDA